MPGNALKLTVPSNLTFADLRLTRESDGSISFDWGVIEQICEVNELNPSRFTEAPDEDIASLLLGWYAKHRAQGGEPDLVADSLATELAMDSLLEQPVTHPPGHA